MTDSTPRGEWVAIVRYEEDGTKTVKIRGHDVISQRFNRARPDSRGCRPADIVAFDEKGRKTRVFHASACYSIDKEWVPEVSDD